MCWDVHFWLLPVVNVDLFCSSGHVEVMKLLVSHSADVMCKDRQGYTPLHAAAISGHLDMIKYLLRLVVEVRWRVWHHFVFCCLPYA